MRGSEAPDGAGPADDEAITAIESALHSLARRLRQTRLHEDLTQQAGVDIDQAGLAVLYALSDEKASLRVTDVAARLAIDTPAVTRKAQHLERLGLVGRAKDADDARASRLQLTAEGRRVLTQFRIARHRWLATLLAGWPPAEQRELARLIGRFADEVHRPPGETDH
jgi:DNA-binding MarR family transcriptional regulator